MRHACLFAGLLILAIPALAVCMVESTLIALLVPPTRFSERFPAGPRCAPLGAITIAVIARAAKKKDLAAIPKYADYKTK
jgi:hypothetical protein